MRELQDLEILEIETLDKLNSIKALDSLFFGGGTMLRLCHNLNRYSTDLDFWTDASDLKSLFQKIKEMLSADFKIADSFNKKNTLLFEFQAPNLNRNLKIEVRKDQTNFKWERKIAFSKFSTKQVMVKGLTLEQMMKNKIEALLSRKIIRDCFDIEFLLLRGIELPDKKEALEEMSGIINSFKEKDFKVVLGSILDPKERKFYLSNRFKLLKEEINKKLFLI
ncbi:MAG TPA: nucleotidyl transferase AbiEii/AbiGii toxin family protein [Ignavibacteriaceae bacterium]|nr:nucleotidyl transferase AbiEii/AbiGii toxin family protein [Ignavibacteriaceae bacterium]